MATVTSFHREDQSEGDVYTADTQTIWLYMVSKTQ